MNIPFKRVTWHGFYIILILGSLWYWKRQHDFHQTWLEFVEPTNKNVITFLGRDNEQMTAQIEKTSRDYPSAKADSVMDVCNKINQLKQVLSSSIGLQRNRAGLEIDAAAVGMLSDSIGEKRRQLFDIVQNLHLEDSTLTALQPLMTPEAFDTWLKDYQDGNTRERIFLLDGQHRLYLSVVSAALRHFSALAESFEGPLYFDKVKMVMNPRSRPIAGKRFEAEFYPVFYTSHTDNVTALIDGRPYPFKDGVAHCDTVYHTPGRKAITVTLCVKNPATGQTETVKKEFYIDVVK